MAPDRPPALDLWSHRRFQPRNSVEELYIIVDYPVLHVVVCKLSWPTLSHVVRITQGSRTNVLILCRLAGPLSGMPSKDLAVHCSRCRCRRNFQRSVIFAVSHNALTRETAEDYAMKKKKT